MWHFYFVKINKSDFVNLQKIKKGIMIPFNEVFDGDSQAQLGFDDWMECSIQSVNLISAVPDDFDKKVSFLCSFDTYYYDTDDEELSSVQKCRKEVEIASFVIGKPEISRKTDFLMNVEMNPTFSVVGPGSIKIFGLYSSHELNGNLRDDEEEEEEVLEEEEDDEEEDTQESENQYSNSSDNKYSDANEEEEEEMIISTKRSQLGERNLGVTFSNSLPLNTNFRVDDNTGNEFLTVIGEDENESNTSDIFHENGNEFDE